MQVPSMKNQSNCQYNSFNAFVLLIFLNAFGVVLGFHESYVEYKPLSTDTFQDTQVNGCQIARDETFLKEIIDTWNGKDHSLVIEAKPLEYKEGTSNLFGHLVRRVRRSEKSEEKLPGILLFHTEAGPLDSFLFYKADCLLQKFNAVVFVCDLFSDPYGWGWSTDRTNFNHVCENLVADNYQTLRDRVRSSLDSFLENVPEVDSHRLAAIGWGLNGRPLKELGALQSDDFKVKALATFQVTGFHGEQFHMNLEDEEFESPTSSTKGGGMLLRNAQEDDESWQATLQLLEKELF